jgi:large subunit ribosomal protein L23
MVTEKSLANREAYNQYCFEVLPSANKVEIRLAVERVFDLPNKVLAVKTVNVAGKFRRRSRRGVGGYRRDWKKAVVTLAKGATIPIFEEA